MPCEPRSWPSRRIQPRKGSQLSIRTSAAMIVSPCLWILLRFSPLPLVCVAEKTCRHLRPLFLWLLKSCLFLSRARISTIALEYNKFWSQKTSLLSLLLNLLLPKRVKQGYRWGEQGDEGVAQTKLSCQFRVSVASKNRLFNVYTGTKKWLWRLSLWYLPIKFQVLLSRV